MWRSAHPASAPGPAPPPRPPDTSRRPPTDRPTAPETRSRPGDSLERCTTPASCSTPPPTPCGGSPGAATRSTSPRWRSCSPPATPRSTAATRPARSPSGRPPRCVRPRPTSGPALVERARELKTVVADAETEARELDAQLQDLLLGIPNLPADDVPDGSSDDDAELIRSWGEPVAFDFTAARPRRPRRDSSGSSTCRARRSCRAPGSRCCAGAGAKLERALARYFLDLAEENGYTEFSVPTLVNRETMTGTGQLPKFEQDLFKTGVADRELFLIPTAEVPLTNLHARETLAVDDLPLAYTAHTPCFRSEAGSYGRDTRGLIRMHEFSKVELVRIVEASTSRAGAGAAGDARRGGAAGARAGLPGGQARGRRHRASRRRPPTTSRCGCRGSRSTGRSRRRRTARRSRRGAPGSARGRRTAAAGSRPR